MQFSPACRRGAVGGRDQANDFGPAHLISDIPSLSPAMRSDVLVIGGGNAALCAALSARDAGADVLVLEGADKPWRGGNSKYTRNIRLAHGRDDLMPGTYEESEFLDDLEKVSGKDFDSEMAAFVIAESRSVAAWMAGHGVRWQAALGGTLGLARTNRFFLGGGKALLNVYYRHAANAGVRLMYEARV